MGFLNKKLELQENGKPELTTFGLFDACILSDSATKTFAGTEYGTTSAVVVSDKPIAVPEGISCRFFSPWGQVVPDGHMSIYIETLDIADSALDRLIDFALENKPDLLVRCCNDLEEAGRIESRHKLSPIMLLHKYGVLEYSSIVGGVFLDKDDVDLMLQSNTKLIITPTDDIGGGRGIPPAASYLARGLNFRLGTGSGKYNRSRSLLKEAELLRSTSSALMHDERILQSCVLYDILSDKDHIADWYASTAHSGAGAFEELLFSERNKILKKGDCLWGKKSSQ